MYFTNCFKYFVDVIELMIQWSKTEQNTNHDHCELTQFWGTLSSIIIQKQILWIFLFLFQNKC